MALTQETNENSASTNQMGSSSSLAEGNKLKQHLAAIIVNLAAICNGCVVSWASPMVPVLQSDASPLDQGAINTEEGSWLSSLMCLGALLATPLYLYLAHHLSRKITGYLVAVPFIVSWILIIVADSVPVICIARFIGGMGSGAITVFSPIYVAETAEDSVRGALGSYLILFCNVGVVFGYIIGSLVSYYTFAYIMIQIPVLYAICYIWLPETPVYLINKGRNADAERSLRWLRGNNDQVIQNELAKTLSFIKERKALPEAATFKDIFTSTGSRRAFVIGSVLVTTLQFCGIFAILSYTVNIFQEAGSDLSPHASSIIVGFLQLAGSCVSSLLIDKAGRKVLLMVSNLSMAICLAALGSYFFLKYQESDVSIISWLPVTCLSVYIFAIALGLAPITFVIIAEIFEPQIKGKATTVIISLLWFLTFVIGKFYPSLTDLLEVHGCFWFFSASCILGAIYCFVAVPETRNRSFESILLELSGQKSESRTKEVESL